MKTLLKTDRKPEVVEFMKLLGEMNLDEAEQKVLLGFIQGMKLAKDMEKGIAVTQLAKQQTA